jgi:hypothetical protein
MEIQFRKLKLNIWKTGTLILFLYTENSRDPEACFVLSDP